MIGAIVAALRRGWLTYLLITVAFLAAWGWIKPFLEGPDLRFSTLTRTRPVPVEVPRTEWLVKVEKKIVRERVEVPVEVIREVPVKVVERIERDFGLKLPELRGEGRELVDVLEVPPAPHGGEMALTIHTGTGKIDGIFRARPMPLFELGGMREVGLDYDPLNAAATAYYRQDLVRVGPAIINGRVFAAAPTGGDAGVPSYGVSLGVAIRF
ncbi:MAG: hypothetical protein ACXW5J_26760 [Thermoanaerobaculia bacterium]